MRRAIVMATLVLALLPVALLGFGPTGGGISAAALIDSLDHIYVIEISNGPGSHDTLSRNFYLHFSTNLTSVKTGDTLVITAAGGGSSEWTDIGTWLKPSESDSVGVIIGNDTLWINGTAVENSLQLEGHAASYFTSATDFGKVTDDTTNYQSAYSRTSGTTPQWVTGAMIDSTANPVIFSGASHVTSAEADSAYVTKGYVDAHDVTNDAYVWAYRSGSDQALASGSWTKIQFNGENRDLGSDWNTTNHEFTAPDSGFYVIDARCQVDAVGGADQEGFVSMAIYRNDSLKVQGTKLQAAMNIGGIQEFPDNDAPVVGATLYVPSGGKIQIYGYQSFDSGGGVIKQNDEITWVTIRKVN